MLAIQFSKLIDPTCPLQGGWAKAKDFAQAVGKTTQSLLRDCHNKHVRVRHVGRTPWISLDDYNFAMEHGVAPPPPPAPRRVRQVARTGQGPMG